MIVAALTVVGLVVGFCVLIVLPLIVSMMGVELTGLIPVVCDALVARASRSLPPGHRERWAEEVHADLAVLQERPLSALLHAVDVLIKARDLGRQLQGMQLESPSDARSSEEPSGVRMVRPPADAPLPRGTPRTLPGAIGPSSFTRVGRYLNPHDLVKYRFEYFDEATLRLALEHFEQCEFCRLAATDGTYARADDITSRSG